jgi:hypothetical protein
MCGIGEMAKFRIIKIFNGGLVRLDFDQPYQEI